MEIAGGEHLRDVTQMHLDLIAAGRVFGIIGGDLNPAAVRVEEVTFRECASFNSPRFLATISFVPSANRGGPFAPRV
jgi:hypothetical protein